MSLCRARDYLELFLHKIFSLSLPCTAVRLRHKIDTKGMTVQVASTHHMLFDSHPTWHGVLCKILKDLDTVEIADDMQQNAS